MFVMDKASETFNLFFYIYAVSMTAIVPMKVMGVKRLYEAGYCYDCNRDSDSETDEPEPLK